MRGRLHKICVFERTAAEDVDTTYSSYWWLRNLEKRDSSVERHTAQKLFRGTAVGNVDDTYDDFGKPNWNSLMERILHTNLVFRWTAIGNVTAAHQWQTLRTHRSWSCATLHNNHMFSVKAVMIHANGTGKFCKSISNGTPSCIPASPDMIHSEQKSSKNCRLKQIYHWLTPDTSS